MAQEDFDIDRLAAYLHMMPAAVLKLAERGKLPGRRVGGEWRFSAAEIHHWLEDRIGLSDDEALVQMEGALDRAADDATSTKFRSPNCCKSEAIEVPLDARTRGSVITQDDRAGRAHASVVGRRENGRGRASPRRNAFHGARQRRGAAASAAADAGDPGRGRAGPGHHARRHSVRQRRQLTDIFFLICSTSDHEHLRILARLSRVINDQDFLCAMRAAESAAALHH